MDEWDKQDSEDQTPNRFGVPVVVIVGGALALAALALMLLL